ncbi:hypothetical protein CAPTEDRAFT_33898, partial [Capitella teleta]
DDNQEETFNRLFILGGKGTTEEVWRETFEQYGQVKDIWIVRDRNSSEEKGICYITFSKASEAALAIEEMNGRCLANNPKPLKVLLANNRREGNVRDPKEEEKMLRIFIMVPKHFTDDDVRASFKGYGDIHYVRLLKDPHSSKSKGLAFVKYYRAYHAAKALEECDASFKAVFAKEKPDKRRDNYESYNMNTDYRPAPGMGLDHPRACMRHLRHEEQDPIMNMVSSHRNMTSTCSRSLEVTLTYSLSEHQLNRLFDIAPGFQQFAATQEPSTVLVDFSSAACAAYAKDKLQGFEYPPGFPLSEAYSCDDLNEPYDPNDLVLLQATSIIQQAGLSNLVPNTLSASDGMESVDYCNLRLPQRKPFAMKDSGVEERLFIVSQPDTFPEHILQDTFGRFGNLVDAYFMPGRNFGYVKFACKESAQEAMKTLHGQSICNMRLKVMLADPPK